MNIKQLKEIIKDLPDNMKIVMPGSDHNYNVVDARIDTALYSGEDRVYTEDFGDEYYEKGDGERVRVLVINR